MLQNCVGSDLQGTSCKSTKVSGARNADTEEVQWIPRLRNVYILKSRNAESKQIIELHRSKCYS